jgi:tRNA-specific 2-thiouridylase
MSVTDDRFFSSGREWRPAGARSDAVAVLMSGGVDSSVTAAMLLRAGREVVGVTMLIPSALGPDCGGAELRACCGQGASTVAAQLGTPHYFVDVRGEFRRLVIDRFRRAYRQGRTPSPCIDCNTHIKFRVAMDLIRDELGIEQVATGHYARVRDGGLWRGNDPRKDQSYFLYGIERGRLSRILMPLGYQTKDETRTQAESMGLSALQRAESAELCFAGQGDYRAALGDAPDAGPGDVLDLDGNVIGRHKGIAQYTVGQRGGLGIAGGVRLYVVDIDPAANTVVLGPREAAASATARAGALNLLAPDMIAEGSRLTAKTNSRQAGTPGTVTQLADGELEVSFDNPQHGVTPGQHIVLYAADGRVAGGGELLRREQRGAV